MTSNTPRSIGSQVRRLAHNAVALATGGFVAQLVFTLIEILVARKLGAEAYGVFATAYAWVVLGSVLIGFGTSMWSIQEGSRRHDRIPTLLGSGLTVDFVVFAALYLAIALVVGNLHAPNAVLGCMLILMPYGLVLAVQNNLAAVYASFQTMHVSAFFQGLAPVVILLFYFLFSASELSLADVAIAYVIGGVIATGIWLIVTVRRVRPNVSLQSLRTTLRSSYQYALSGALGQVYFRVDIIMLSALAGLQEAGIYAAAYKLVELVSKVAQLSGRVFAPAVFKASHEPGKTFRIFVGMMTRFLAIAGLVAGIGTFVLSDQLILWMFGDSYAASGAVLRILGGVMATRCMMVALQLLLSSIDLHFQRVARLAITIAAHIVANALLIPKFGAPGAAWASLFSGALLIFLYASSTSKQRDFQFLRWLLVPSCVAALIALGTLLLDVNALVSAAAAVSVFLASLFMTGFVRRDEISFVFRSVRSG